MTIYECLGIDHILLDQEIPKDLIIKNIEKEDLRHDAEFYFRVIDQVSLRASIQRGEDHFLQVLEITLNSPDFIREISFLIQKAIKYRVLFIFVFEGRYLIVRRSFNLTMSTENVHTDSAPFCSDWIYEEYLHLDILYSHKFCAVEEYAEANEEAVRLLKTDADNGDYILFKDLLSSAERLNKCIVESECISTRWFIDWLRIHVAGQRVEIGDFIERIEEREAYQFIGDYLFIDKTCARYAMTALDNTFYKLPSLSMDHTGKWPMRYFEGISSPSTHEEAEILSHAIQYGADDIIFLELQSHKADERRRLDDEHKRFLEDRRREAEQRKAAEDQRKLDEWRKEWEQQRLELLQPVDEPDGSDEDDLEEEELEFDDISFAIYDKDSIHIEFCNFEVDDDNVYMTFWANNLSEGNVMLWAKEITLDGGEFCDSVCIGAIFTGNSSFCKICLGDIPTEGYHTVDCHIEIEDLKFTVLDRTQRVSVEVDFDELSQVATLHNENQAEACEDDIPAVFEDISFAISDRENVHIEFCNIESDDYDLYMVFWINNRSGEDIFLSTLAVAEDHIIGERECSFGIEHIKAGDSCWYRLPLEGITQYGKYDIDCITEIETGAGSHSHGYSQRFMVRVDFDTFSQSAEFVKGKEIRLINKYDAYDSKVEDVSVEFWGVEVDDAEVFFNFLVCNNREDSVNVFAMDIHLDGVKVVDHMHIGECKGERFCYGRFTLPQINSFGSHSIKAYIEIDDCEDCDYIDHGDVFKIDLDVNMGILSAKNYAQEEAAQRQLEEERRRAEEQRRLEEERRKAEEQRRLEEERRKAEEQRRLEEERRKAEKRRRLEEEQRRVAEQRRLEEERRKVEEQCRIEKEMVRRKEAYRAQKLCQHCGGRFKGFFKKVCSNCGRSKDY